MGQATAPFSYSLEGGTSSDKSSAKVSIFADRALLRQTLSDQAQEVGLMVAHCETLDRLRAGDALALGDVVLVDIPALTAACLAALLHLDARAERNGTQLVVSTTPDALDMVFACLVKSDAQILVNPGDADRALALGIALARQPGAAVREMAVEDRVALVRLTEQVGMLARRIEGLTQTDAAVLAPEAADQTSAGDMNANQISASSGATQPLADLPPAALLREIIRHRQQRSRFFDAELFADPAWDILLDLTAAKAEQRQVSVSSLCIAACVPPTTALRWIGQLTDAGLLQRVQDQSDRRRVFIAMTQKATQAMAGYFARVGSELRIV
ncbi:winged helix DNA-binding protein [Croceicoccus sp. F390]|uniref:Winged helix DNA-binding protein n=1 Tax=Croceicoccus esteveae TaxID=3075597 RepID=A0ABU2ZIN8_9SPHN|nr:winged helix DNA-binding protein [Croceicoccus sp. F390]MDT0576169.1 winged helix DNA-binding protein [Croceicoccus sp. F390]